jgi:predicted metalloprotease
VIYSLTSKGEALLPVVLAIRQWGEDWGYGHMDIVLADVRERRPVRRIRVLAEDGRELSLGEMTWISRDELEGKADEAA